MSQESPALQPLEFSVRNSASGTALQTFLAEALACSKRKAKRILDDRRVWVNDRRVWMAQHRLKSGDRVRVLRLPETPCPALLQQQDGLWVFNKPPGMLSTGSSRSAEALLRNQRNINLRAVHRLDRDTSGCLLLAENPALLEAAQQCFRRRQVLKVYWAVLIGRLPEDCLSQNTRIDGKEAASDMQVIRRSALATLVRVRLHTGRTHQIRKHAAELRHPVAGDKQYGAARVAQPALRNLPRQMLHARTLRIEIGATALQARAPLPADFKQALRALGLNSQG